MKITANTENYSFGGPSDVEAEVFKEETRVIDTRVIIAWKKFQAGLIERSGNRHFRRSEGYLKLLDNKNI